MKILSGLKSSYLYGAQWGQNIADLALLVPEVKWAGYAVASISSFIYITHTSVSHTLEPLEPVYHIQVAPIGLRIRSRIHRGPLELWWLSGHGNLTFSSSVPGLLLSCHTCELLPTVEHWPFFFPFSTLIALPTWRLPLCIPHH